MNSYDITKKYTSESDTIKAFYRPVTTDEKAAIFPRYANVSNKEYIQISINLAKSEEVTIKVLTLTGMFIKYLSKDELPAGESYFKWYGESDKTSAHGRLVSPGTYIIHIEGASFEKKKKVYIGRKGTEEDSSVCGSTGGLGFGILFLMIIFLFKKALWMRDLK